MALCAVLFPVLGALVLIAVHGADAQQSLWILQRAGTLMVAFQAMCGLVGGYILSRVNAKWFECLILGLVCGYLCVLLFSLYATLEWTHVPVTQGLIIGVPAGAIASIVVAIPRVIGRILTDRQ